MSIPEIVGTVFGALCVWLYVRQNIWSWPAGLVQVLLFIVVFYEAKLYSDLILHVIYVGLQIYGWHHWLHGGERGTVLDASRLGARDTMLWAGAALAGAVGWGYMMATFTDAALPYPDALIATTSLVAQWLITRKKLESWLFWILVDVVAITVYLAKGLYFATALYAMFLALSIAGYRAWRASIGRRTEAATDGATEAATASSAKPSGVTTGPQEQQ